MNIGKAGEQAFAHKLRGSKYQVEDLTGNPAYFSKDIDFLVINPETGNRRAYEVKSDSRISQTGNCIKRCSEPNGFDEQPCQFAGQHKPTESKQRRAI